MLRKAVLGWDDPRMPTVSGLKRRGYPPNALVSFAKAAGVARFAYNWGLENWQKQYDKYKEDKTSPKPSQLSLRRHLNSIKKMQFPWMLEVTKNSPQMALIQLGKAFNNFFLFSL